MKRNWNLIRCILLEIENSDGMDAFLNLSDDGYRYTNNLKMYDSKDIIYHVQLLVKADFISTNIDDYGEQELTGLTWKGHEYAEKLRDEDRWKKIELYIIEKNLDFGSDTIMSLVRKRINKTIENDNQ